MTRAGASSGNRGGERNPGDLADCFTFGRDEVGRGDFDHGVETWDGCFTDDYSFEFVFFSGTAFLDFDGAPVGSGAPPTRHQGP